MLRILARTAKSANMVTRSESEFEKYDVLEDLSSWEFVNPSDDEQEDSFSFSDETTDDESDENQEKVICEIGSPVSDISMQSPASGLIVCDVGVVNYHANDDDEVDAKQEKDICEIGSPVSDISMQSPSSSLTPVQVTSGLIVCDVGVVNYSSNYHVNDDDYEEEEEDYEDDEYDLDDELVPKWFDKLGRQRIRKLGKRAGSRMKKSKKGPQVFNRSGCVGKHGLGYV